MEYSINFTILGILILVSGLLFLRQNPEKKEGKPLRNSIILSVPSFTENGEAN